MFDDVKSAIYSFFSKENTLYQKNKIDDLLIELKNNLLDSDISIQFVNSVITDIQSTVSSIEDDNIDIKKRIFNNMYHKIQDILGKDFNGITLQKDKMTIIMLCGSQGAGKTAFCVKLCNKIKQSKPNIRVAVCSVDIKRPAAQTQLQNIAKEANIDFIGSGDFNFTNITQYASYLYNIAYRSDYSVLVVDTQGISPVNMLEVKRLYSVKEAIKPDEIFLVLDSTIGQVATNIANKFEKLIGITGIVLTKIDGDSNIGVAINVRTAINKPIKYLSIGEKITDIEEFHPNRIAKRILNIKDSEGLIEHLSNFNSSLETKVFNGTFDFNDLYDQLSTIKNNHNVGYILSFLPSKLSANKIDKQKNIAKQMSIILSMTVKERQDPNLINISRQDRIAKGSGTSQNDVLDVINRLLRLKKALATS